MKQKLLFKGKDTKWTTEEDLEIHAEEGRCWAQMIFDAILFMARSCRKLPGSVLDNISDDLEETSMMLDVMDTCERCLERLRPEVFFSQECSSGITQFCGNNHYKIDLLWFPLFKIM